MSSSLGCSFSLVFFHPLLIHKLYVNFMELNRIHNFNCIKYLIEFIIWCTISEIILCMWHILCRYHFTHRKTERTFSFVNTENVIKHSRSTAVVHLYYHWVVVRRTNMLELVRRLKGYTSETLSYTLGTLAWRTEMITNFPMSTSVNNKICFLFYFIFLAKNWSYYVNSTLCN